MDHLAFEVSDESALLEWREELDRLRVEHSPIRDLGHSRFISIEDPDGIQIELWHTVIPHRPAEEWRP